MFDLVICEICGTSFNLAKNDDCEICPSCRARSTQPAPKTALTPKAQAARNTAKAFGGKALKGTAKQKEWAEKIRATFMSSLTIEEAARVAEMTTICGTAKFWIENRAKTVSQLKDFIKQQGELFSAYKSAHAAGDAENVKKYAEAYNALTSAWGIK